MVRMTMAPRMAVSGSSVRVRLRSLKIPSSSCFACWVWASAR